MPYTVEPLDPDWLLDFVNGHAATPRTEAGELDMEPVLPATTTGPQGLARELTIADRTGLADLLYGALADPGPERLAELDRAVSGQHVQARVMEDHGRLRLAIETPDPSAAFLLDAVTTLEQVLAAGGERSRVGVCDAHRCADVYLDRSQAGTRRYCSSTCHNRAKVAAYRARRRQNAD